MAGFGGVDRAARQLLERARALEVPVFSAGDAARPDPLTVAAACGFDNPDEWQKQVLTSTEKKQILCCSRQSGKSTTTAIVAVDEAVHVPGALVLLVSPGLRQSSELARKIILTYESLTLDKPDVFNVSALKLELMNGARVVALPGNEATVRGYSAATLVIVDEASKVDDSLMAAVRPTLATTDGRLILLSTPAGKRGFFWEAWSQGKNWERTEVRAADNPRITAEFLADQRRELGEFIYQQEYENAWLDQESSVFSSDLIQRIFANDLEPLFAMAE